MFLYRYPVSKKLDYTYLYDAIEYKLKFKFKDVFNGIDISDGLLTISLGEEVDPKLLTSLVEKSTKAHANLPDKKECDLYMDEDGYTNILGAQIVNEIKKYGLHFLETLKVYSSNAEPSEHFSNLVTDEKNRVFEELDYLVLKIGKLIFDYDLSYKVAHSIPKSTLLKIGYDLEQHYLCTIGGGQVTGEFLNPALCVHCYHLFENRMFNTNDGVAITLFGKCFRNEGGNHNNFERFKEFTMRELVFIGDHNYIHRNHKKTLALFSLLSDLLMVGSMVKPAYDIFFDNQESEKVFSQKLMQSKTELSLYSSRSKKHIAIASVNRHGSFFSRNLNIKSNNGLDAQTMCIGFGYERIVNILFDCTTKNLQKIDC